MNSSELACALHAWMDAWDDPVAASQAMTGTIGDNVPIQIKRSPDRGRLRVLMTLGSLLASARASALISLMLANGELSAKSRPYFALCQDRTTVVLCCTLTLEAQAFETVWCDLETLAEAARQSRHELGRAQYITF